MLTGSHLHYSGAASELLVGSHLLAEGADVYFPSMGQGRCDLIYLRENEAVKVQVKTTTWSKSGVWKYEQCRLSMSRGSVYQKTYTTEEIDELWVVGTHLWCFPSSLIAGRTSLCLNTSRPIARKSSRDYVPDDYIVKRGSFETPIRP